MYTSMSDFFYGSPFYRVAHNALICMARWLDVLSNSDNFKSLICEANICNRCHLYNAQPSTCHWSIPSMDTLHHSYFTMYIKSTNTRRIKSKVKEYVWTFSFVFVILFFLIRMAIYGIDDDRRRKRHQTLVRNWAKKRMHTRYKIKYEKRGIEMFSTIAFVSFTYAFERFANHQLKLHTHTHTQTR